MEKRDPRNSSLKFMYSIPQSQDSSANSSNNAASTHRAVDKLTQSSASSGIYVPPGQDDKDVQKFRAKLHAVQNNTTTIYDNNSVRKKNDSNNEISSHEAISAFVESQINQQELQKLKSQPNFGKSAKYTKLESDVGRKRKLGMTHDEQVCNSTDKYNCLFILINF